MTAQCSAGGWQHEWTGVGHDVRSLASLAEGCSTLSCAPPAHAQCRD